MGVFAAGCEGKQNHDTAKPSATAEPPQTFQQPKRSLPRHVLSDTYVGGVRTIIFKTKKPEFFLQVTELCDRGRLITQTTRFRRAQGDSQVYHQVYDFTVSKDKDCSPGEEIDPSDQRPVPTPHPSPTPTPTPDTTTRS